ncbi:Glycerate kinase [Hondaea fermentalgiana]|uniref:Glycerate kinase n=1 Tax=Hondaea fermentalgiana TaxID=2315210 RepID=A0A2R5G5M4_9STRA|nr:Glycerate kinase [Hondaea fermentalgiana]|eukprot:GBG25649.1 Glycerate kinase [Hondaea fermentalgiana]
MASSPARGHARDILAAAIRGAEPRRAVDKALREHDQCVKTLARVDRASSVSDFERVLLTGQGKAAVQMCTAALQTLAEHAPAVSDAICGGLVVTKHGHATQEERDVLAARSIRIAEAGHPVPDADGVAGTEALLALVKDADERTLVLNFISGGGSALTCVPAKGLTLHDIQTTVNLLLGSGAPIEDMNTVRRHLTRFQGGRFAGAIAPGTVLSLILSDVVGDPLEVIAGGSTSPDPTTFADCAEILNDEALGIASSVPAAVWDFLKQPQSALEELETCKPGSSALARASNLVVASNRESLREAKIKAEALGYNTRILTSQMQGEARHAATFLAGIAADARDQGTFGPLPACILVGGETTVTLSHASAPNASENVDAETGSDPVGGRNQEFALAAALALRNEPRITILAAGTDGQDGPCDAAGAVIDGEVCKSRQDLARAKRHLARHDSYGFFRDSSMHILTGPTGTNVMDLCVVLVDEEK